MVLKTFTRLFFTLLFVAVLSSGAAQAQIEITAPAYASEIIAGRGVRIEWTGASGLPVTLYYSVDNGVTWTTIVQNVTANFYIWEAPDINPAELILKAELLRQGNLEKIWEIPSTHPSAHLDEIRSAIISPAGDVILSSARNSNQYRLWDIATKSVIAESLPAVALMYYNSSFLHSADTLVFAVDSTILVHDRKTQQYITLGKGIQTDYARSIAVHPSRAVVAAACNDGFIRVYNIATSTQIAVFSEPNFSAYTVAFSPDGETLAYAGDNTDLLKSPVYIRNWETSNAVTKLDGHGENGSNRTVWSVHFSPDGKKLVSGGVDNTVRVWNLDSRSQERLFKTNTFHVRSVKFSPEGKRVISGSLDSTIRQWDIKSGREITAAANHNGQILAVDYSMTGDTVLSAGRDKTIKLWKNSGTIEDDTLRLHLEVDTLCAADKRRMTFGETTAIVNLFPNPADVNPTFIFTLAEDGMTALKLFSVQGVLVKIFFTESLKSGKYERTLNIADVSAGAYILRLETPTQTIEKQLTIVK